LTRYTVLGEPFLQSWLFEVLLILSFGRLSTGMRDKTG